VNPNCSPGEGGFRSTQIAAERVGRERMGWCKNKLHPPRTQGNRVNDKITVRNETIKTFFSFAIIQRES
jgi:hypothetical protein